MNESVLSRWQMALLFFLSFFVVAWGQPARIPWLGLMAAVCGWALFWRFLLAVSSGYWRFFWGMLWFSLVQGVQLSWFFSHPYSYIIGVHLLLSLLTGAQFGLLSLWITPSHVRTVRGGLVIASLWTVCEWSRLFLLSGFSWNPTGLALTGALYPMQFASIGGVFALSFWVIITNLFFLNIWLYPKRKLLYVGGAFMAFFPYVFGVWQVAAHQELIDRAPTLNTLLVQPAFSPRGMMGRLGREELAAIALGEWEHMIALTSVHKEKPIDLLLFPEFVVSFGVYTFFYDLPAVQQVFEKYFGPEVRGLLPKAELPLVVRNRVDGEERYTVNNAYWAQALANVFESELVIGLEDVDRTESDGREFYSAALFFRPQDPSVESEGEFSLDRYEKRVLVPMGEYIPFSFCRDLAACYGIVGSLTPGKEATLFSGARCLMGVSICYEETFGDITREARVRGAEVLLNLTSDVWFPDSLLVQQHFDHARLRSVESGISLVRSCNTGITGVFDGLGRIVKKLGKDSVESESLSSALSVSVPLYTFPTLYSLWGDGMIVGFSLLILLFSVRWRT